MVKIIPSILAQQEKDWVGAVTKIDGHFSEVQIDICAKDFVNTETIPINKMSLPQNWRLGWHLMVNFFNDWHKILIDQAENIIIHAESQLAKEKFKRDAKIKWGMAINPETEITEEVFTYDFVQLMGVVPGGQGREFNPKILEKIPALKKLGFTKPIWVDGGIDKQSIMLLKGLDIKVLVVGSYLLGKGDILINKKVLEKSFYE